MEIWFLGVMFRSKYHFRHFIVSVVALGISLVAFFVLGGGEEYFTLVFIYSVFGLFFFSLFLQATIETEWGDKNGEVWSKDCIWFNGLMAFIFFLEIVGALAHKSYFQ